MANQKSLIKAAKSHLINKVEDLLIQGVDPNCRGHRQSTPLHGAAGRGNEKISKRLIEYGAAVNAVNDYADTPMHNAAMYGHENVCKILIQYGADKNAINKGGQTPMNVAKTSEYIEDLAKKDSIVNVLK